MPLETLFGLGFFLLSLLSKRFFFPSSFLKVRNVDLKAWCVRVSVVTPFNSNTFLLGLCEPLHREAVVLV